MRPLEGCFGVMGIALVDRKFVAGTIIIMAASTFCIGLIPLYASIGIWAPVLLLLCKLAQGFSVGGEYTGAAIFVAEYAPDRRRFLGSHWISAQFVCLLLGAGLVVFLSSLVGEVAFLEWGRRYSIFDCSASGLIGLYLRHAAEAETPAFTHSNSHNWKGGPRYN